MLLTELPLADAIALLAAIRVGGDEELESIRPLQRFSLMASPGGRANAQWMSSLYRAGVLLPSAESPASTFQGERRVGELRYCCRVMGLARGRREPSTILRDLTAACGSLGEGEGPAYHGLYLDRRERP